MQHQGQGRRMGGRGRGMGMNRGVGSGNRAAGPQDRPAASNSHGSMRNEHLQLHDLDLELALLKRKRELIEQQQHLLINNQSYNRPNEFAFNEREQPRGRPFSGPEYAEPRSAPARNVGHFYNDGPSGAPARFDRPYGKRPGDDWPANPNPPKRFSAPRGRRNRPGQGANSRPGPGPSPNSRPAPSPRPAPVSRPAPTPARPSGSGASTGTARGNRNRARNFNPTKVTKPTQNTSPNNLNSYPVEQRKNLVAQAAPLTKAKDSEEYILRDDVTPSRKLLGRLELALGVYLKELRTEHQEGPYGVSLRSPLKLRLVKQSIRERIRSAMLGKHAASAADIMAIVREKYPKDTDEDMLKMAMQSARLAIQPVDAEDPETYIQQNFNMLLGRKLSEIFEKVQKMYSNDPDNGKTTQNIIDSLILEMSENAPAVNGDADTSATEVTEVKPEETPTHENAETVKAIEIEIEPIENPLEAKEAAVETAENPDNPKEGVKNPEEENPVEITQVEEGNVEQTETKAEEAPVAGGTQGENKPNYILDTPAAFYNNLVDKLLKRRLPQLLPKFKDQLIAILRSDNGYKETKAFLLQQANKKAEALYGKKGRKDNAGASQNQNAQQKDATQKQQPKNPKFFPYFVKIMGRPSLPKRKNMQVFLDQFNPASIKKHRGIHNLLFVALSTKEDYDKMMAANKTVIGNSTLDIRVGGKKDAQGGSQEPADGEGELKAEPLNDSTNLEKLDQSLDAQLSDLNASLDKQESKVAIGEDGQEIVEIIDDATSVEIIEPSEGDQLEDDQQLKGDESFDGAQYDEQGETFEGGEYQGEYQGENGDDENAGAYGEDGTDDVQILEEPNPEPPIEIEDSHNEEPAKPATPEKAGTNDTSAAPITPGRALRSRQVKN